MTLLNSIGSFQAEGILHLGSQAFYAVLGHARDAGQTQLYLRYHDLRDVQISLTLREGHVQFKVSDGVDPRIMALLNDSNLSRWTVRQEPVGARRTSGAPPHQCIVQVDEVRQVPVVFTLTGELSFTVLEYRPGSEGRLVYKEKQEEQPRTAEVEKPFVQARPSATATAAQPVQRYGYADIFENYTWMSVSDHLSPRQTAGRSRRPLVVEESPGSTVKRRRITSARGDPRESATESKPPPFQGREG